MGKGEDGGASIFLDGGCICVFCVLLGLSAIGIAEVVIGAKYLHDCSIEDMVPIYLIVSAFAPILMVCFVKTIDNEKWRDHARICSIVGFLFNISWLICGSAWIYPAHATLHKDTYVPCAVNGTTGPAGCTEGTCNGTLINFSYAMVTLHWVCMAFLLLFKGCLLCATIYG